MDNYFLSKNNFLEFLKNISPKYDLYLPILKDQNLTYVKYPAQIIDDIEVGLYRPVESLKGFLFFAKEKVAVFPDASAALNLKKEDKPRAIFGLKACDLKSLKILDYVFLKGDLADPFYAKARENTLIISSDCTAAKEVCFCSLLGFNPFPEDGFDLNLSKINSGFVATVGTEKGKKIIEGSKALFRKADSQEQEEAEANRKKITEKVKKQIEDKKIKLNKPLSELVTQNSQHSLWSELAAKCVECGACNFVCPTCHCFLLADAKVNQEKEKFVRLRLWDSCQYAGFARVAGGANPRKRREERFKNRFDKKFNFFYKHLGIYACTGCGRCAEACPAGIDLREVFKGLNQ